MAQINRVNLVGISRTIPWTNSKGTPLPRVGGEVISLYENLTEEQALIRCEELNREHRSTDFTATIIPQVEYPSYYYTN